MSLIDVVGENPKIIIYLEFRIQLFYQIMHNGYVGIELQLRNNDKIRKIIAEVICVLCDAKKRHEYNEINDIRLQQDFKGYTFSNFKKTDVKKELIENLKKGKIEQSCYWSAEFVCSGHYGDLWDIIIDFFSKYIHIGNPKIISYLEMRIEIFKNILNNGYTSIELQLRNNQKIRRLFAEVICVLCDSKKRHSYSEIKVKQEDFDLTYMTERFKAPNISYAEPIFLKDDPKELFIASNEFAYNISEESKNSVGACYWMEWIIQFENICKYKKEKCQCERRMFAQVDPKLQMEIIWILWDIFLNESSKRNNLIQKLINSALKIFCLKYTSRCYKKRRYIMYFVIEILTEQYQMNEPIVKEEDKQKIEIVLNNINTIYRQIKKNEITPNTEYLFNGLNGNNLRNTIAKLEQMNLISEDFTPRLDSSNNS